MRPHIIGIAAPRGWGKGELGRHLVEKLPGTAIVSLDSYYRGMEEIPLEARKKMNFDHPDALDWTLLHEHLKAMAAGEAIDEPVYSFADYARTGLSRRIEPGRYAIVEGLFVLYWPELRDMLDTKVYVETASAAPAAPGLRRLIERGGYAIVEGLFVLYWPELRDMLDTKVYVETDPAVCFNRRLTRDVAERGRTPQSVCEQI